jgi:hypothetical protein
MLAASRRVSKVPPNDVQAAPVQVAAALTAHQLGESRPTCDAQPDPAEAWQENTAGDKLACAPLTVRPEHRHATARSEANFAAGLPGTVQDSKLPGRCNAPQEHGTRSKCSADRQHRKHNDADQREPRADAEYQTPQ